MVKGQATLELLLGYSIALILIAAALAVLFLLYPSLFTSSPNTTFSGFNGLRITGQGYDSNIHIYYIKFQNLLNENINLTHVYFIDGAINQSNFLCTSRYIPSLGFGECNLSVSLSGPYSASVDIVYTPSNTSMHPNIQITGSVSG
ncbi:MAG: hypothetical protein M1433_02885 [Candidatus Parvarchaeota archaeon]|nr:hypothetical protein [Candidatus Parvarchaeota archaeon]